jgi:hypothetical protein
MLPAMLEQVAPHRDGAFGILLLGILEMPHAARHPATFSEEQLLVECSRQTTRRSGPGGQHRNKVETAVVLAHIPTGIRAEAHESRSQAQNGKSALFRLRRSLAEQICYPVEPHSPPSELWQSRVPRRKLAVSDDNFDFPALLAEALDRVAVHEFDLKNAAEYLRISTTQLARFLQQSTLGWEWVNSQRKARGLRPLC